MTATGAVPLPAFDLALRSLQSGAITYRVFLTEVNRLLASGTLPADLLAQLTQHELAAPLPERSQKALQVFIETWPLQSPDAAVAASLTGESVVPSEAETIILDDGKPDAANDAALPADGGLAFAPGDVLVERFELVKLIGEGGMSRVYQALDLLAPQPEAQFVALKILLRPIAEDSDVFIALRQEIDKLRGLSHPNIVRLLDCHHQRSVAFITMELIDGASLYAALRAGNSPDRLGLIRQIAAALQYAHEHDVVHGDLKPGNVMLTAGDLKVIDFGIAALVSRPQTALERREAAQTRNALAVTPRYASPQLMARNAPTPADDVYALACLTYEVMTGVHPFDLGVEGQPLTFPPAALPGLNPAQYSAIVSGLQFERQNRTSSIREFITDFERPERFDAAPQRSSRTRVAVAVALALLLVVAGWLLLHPSKRVSPLAVAPPAVLPNPEEPGSVLRDCPDCAPMKVLPAGQFLQGAVTIAAPFAMAVNDVTVGDFAQFVAATGRDMNGCEVYDGTWHRQPDANWNNPGFAQTSYHPVTCVSWSDAVAYAQWLSTKSGHAYRLPSAAEWEYASRAGVDAPRPWDANLSGACAYANVADASAAQRYPGWKVLNCDDGYVNTSPVGSFQANAFGLSDMLGNVFQWTQDCWQAGNDQPPSDGSARMQGDCNEHELRGGSWFSNPKLVTASHRNRFATDYRTSSVGFRLVRMVGT